MNEDQLADRRARRVAASRKRRLRPEVREAELAAAKKRREARDADPEIDRQYYDLQRERYVRSRDRNKRLVDAFRAGGCQACEEHEAVCLDAHHVDPDTKDYPIARVVCSTYSAKTIAAELDKCFCLCKNCHTKVHAGLLDLQSLTKRDWRSQLPEDIFHAL